MPAFGFYIHRSKPPLGPRRAVARHGSAEPLKKEEKGEKGEGERQEARQPTREEVWPTG